MAIKFLVISPKKLNTQVFKAALRNAVQKEIKAADKEFAKTYRTFRHKPDFKQSFDETPSTIEGATLTSGEGSTDNPYPFVTKGTSVRYATMTPDFEAKTTPRIIDSRTGKGGIAYIDTRKPRPGIEAREFEEEIAKAEQPKFRERAQAALNEAAKKSGHAI